MFTKTTSNYKHAKAGDGQPQTFTWDVAFGGSKAEDIMILDAARSKYTQLPSADGGELIAEYSDYFGMWIIWHD